MLNVFYFFTILNALSGHSHQAFNTTFYFSRNSVFQNIVTQNVIKIAIYICVYGHTNALLTMIITCTNAFPQKLLQLDNFINIILSSNHG